MKFYRINMLYEKCKDRNMEHKIYGTSRKRTDKKEAKEQLLENRKWFLTLFLHSQDDQ